MAPISPCLLSLAYPCSQHKQFSSCPANLACFSCQQCIHSCPNSLTTNMVFPTSSSHHQPTPPIPLFSRQAMFGHVQGESLQLAITGCHMEKKGGLPRICKASRAQGQQNHLLPSSSSVCSSHAMMLPRLEYNRRVSPACTPASTIFFPTSKSGCSAKLSKSTTS